MPNVEKEISSGLFGAISALLAITLAAFSAIWAAHTKNVESEDPPAVRNLQRKRKKSVLYWRLMASLVIVIFLLLIILFPILKQILSEISPAGTFSTTRAVYILLYAILAITGGVGLHLVTRGKIHSEIGRIQNRINQINGSANKNEQNGGKAKHHGTRG